MSQSSFPASASLDSSATFLSFSDETVKRFIPGFRAAVDAILIFFGVALALAHLPIVSSFIDGIAHWPMAVYAISHLVIGLLGLTIAYCTARSSCWQDRQRVMVCLSLVLFQYAAMSLLGLFMLGIPEALSVLLLVISAASAMAVVCIGLIAVEKRLRSGKYEKEMPERVANRRHCIGRLFFGCCFTLKAIMGLVFPILYVNSMVDGSLGVEFEKAFGDEVSGLNFACLVMLTVICSIHLYLIPFYSWLYLRNFHQKELHSSKKWHSLLDSHPALTAISVCFLGSIVFVISFVLLHPSPDMAPWVLLATISCAVILYRKKAKAIAKESSASTA